MKLSFVQLPFNPFLSTQKPYFRHITIFLVTTALKSKQYITPTFKLLTIRLHRIEKYDNILRYIFKKLSIFIKIKISKALTVLDMQSSFSPRKARPF